MIETALGLRQAFTAPHRLATKTGADVMESGGSAIEAMVAAAATIAVVYPHMNGIGGDGFWLIKKGQEPVGDFACGQAAGLATPQWYAERGHANTIPTRGRQAALTVPGTIGGWRRRWTLAMRTGGPLSDLLAPAIAMRVTASLSPATNPSPPRKSWPDCVMCRALPKPIYRGPSPPPGARFVQTALARHIGASPKTGVDDFYRGDLAATHARFLEQAGSPLRAGGFKATMPSSKRPDNQDIAGDALQHDPANPRHGCADHSGRL